MPIENDFYKSYVSFILYNIGLWYDYNIHLLAHWGHNITGPNIYLQLGCEIFIIPSPTKLRRDIVTLLSFLPSVRHILVNTRINILQWIFTKLGTYLVLRRIWNPIDFQGQCHWVKFLPCNILVNTLESTSFNGFWPNLVHT